MLWDASDEDQRVTFYCKLCNIKLTNIGTYIILSPCENINSTNLLFYQLLFLFRQKIWLLKILFSKKNTFKAVTELQNLPKNTGKMCLSSPCKILTRILRPFGENSSLQNDSSVLYPAVLGHDVECQWCRLQFYLGVVCCCYGWVLTITASFS